MDIQDVKVYDPKQDGLDFETYRKAYDAAMAVNRKAAYAMNDGLFQKVENSEVEHGRTLGAFLNDEDGFFQNHSETVAVLFMDGRFHSQYDREGYKTLELDKLAQQSNAIPFAFSYFPEVDEYLRKQDAIQALTASRG